MDNQNNFIIGKYVIDSLTTGMYDNPFCIYREYIQNSADSIDKAVAENLIQKKDATIYIQIDKDVRLISFEDNGTGISTLDAHKILLDIGNSKKEFGKDKGFRGIGRLGGLSYCDKLIFETSFKGENSKSITTWDAAELRKKLEKREQQESAVEIIKDSTNFKVIPEDIDAHYFRVSMINVTNLDLLETNEVKDYLRMVAPLPFNGSFIFKSLIYDELRNQGIDVDEYRIYVNDEQLYKGYTSFFYDENNGNRKKIGEILRIKFFSARDNEGSILYWGWYSISDIQNKRLKKINKARGLRLRKNNIQVGDEDRLEYLFKDGRFNFYVVGEVYALNQNLVPNSRRDNFEDNVVFNDFKAKLKSTCREIQKLSEDVSKIRSAERDIDGLIEIDKVIDRKNETGFINKEEAQRLEVERERKEEKAKQAEKILDKYRENINKEVDDSPLVPIIKPAIEKNKPNKTPIGHKKTKILTDGMSKLNRADRKLISQIFGIISDVLPKELAENLVAKIQDHFS